MDLLKSKIFPFLGRVRKVFADSLFFVFKIFRSGRKNIPAANTDLDKKLVYSLSKTKIPGWRQMHHLKRVLSKKESRVINFLIFFIILNLAFIGFNFGRSHLKAVPVAGGQYSEGLIGAPARINPLYESLNDADSDISRLIYSSLFKYGENGELVKDLADDYQISADGTTYTIKIKNDVRWHHGEKLSADDIVFTFAAIKNPAYNSPLRFSFEGVEITKQDDRTVVFKLSEKYAPFLGLLTFGILPEGLWDQISPESASLAKLNLEPIGSGPYEFKSLSKDKSGNIKIFNLTVNKNYYGQKPYLKEISFKFYGDQTEAISALNNNDVDGLNYLPKENKNDLIARNSLNFHQLNLPRIKAVFFNQEKNKFLKEVKTRQALAYSSPRNEIIDKALSGSARPVTGPILPDNFAYDSAVEKFDFNLDKAAALLAEAGWKKEIITKEEIDSLQAKQKKATTSKDVLTDEEKIKIDLGEGTWLSREIKQAVSKTTTKTTTKQVPAPTPKKEYLTIKLTIIDNDEDAAIAEIIKENWEKLGVKTEIEPIPSKEIQTGTIKPRAYEALLFSQQVGNDPDAYVFWHSSQAGAGGLNLSNYKSEEADKMLEEGRTTVNANERIADYKKFQEIIATDTPAVFLFSPYYTYVQNKKIKGFAVKSIATPSDRFADVSRWYTKTGERLEW